jgi:hypothetical protein
MGGKVQIDLAVGWGTGAELASALEQISTTWRGRSLTGSFRRGGPKIGR